MHACFVGGFDRTPLKARRRAVCLQEKLLQPVWTESDTSSKLGSFTEAPMWRFVIASDGHPVQHLKLLTRGDVRLNLVEVRDLDDDDDVIPEFAKDVPRPALQRKIELIDSSDDVLLYATSWWNASIYHDLIDGYEDLPVWGIFARTQYEVARRIERFHFGYSEEFERKFRCKGPFYAREYSFKRERTPMMKVYEVFSPKLERYLGPMTVPRDLGGGTLAAWQRRSTLR
mmetsp:Transcript_4469/g.13554  ORF Transcript_4469/g.13554 Transcript_4469/m.13554 type:complete len:229 (+) Transcript_4469:143-829(+)|eukprot:CAMPEP_0198735084 /NCGR_PEP_ID=MMETSP1475-20131203/57189_1 /TAXON_ID= ORGANISM="Unidentified sp., Strain CCMP1999" /NCGR_SAMPLE_ID=MMETSP1475 /ASSEMBLY_ACC=CAM_ASM_001111 /LENGTH=228 /DNA_ID=CAMNT_0044498681 /DNA_START=81 /DNA_END=767 /DNA_ORIENTATION=-